jgi:Ras-related protein Rab-1A
LLGSTGVGKSCFVLRYVDNIFPDYPVSTIGVDFKIKKITSVETDKKIAVQIWDLSSGEKYPTIPSSYYRGAHGLVLLVDLTDRNCFEQLIGHVNEIKRYAFDTTKLLLVGAKSDDITRRQISYEEVKQFAEKEGFPYIETSARENKNVIEAVTMIVTAIERDFVAIDAEHQKYQNSRRKNPLLPSDPQQNNNSRKKECLIM